MDTSPLLNSSSPLFPTPGRLQASPLHLLHSLNNNNNNHNNNHNNSLGSGGGGCEGLDCCPEGALRAVEVVTAALALGGFLGNGLTAVAIVSSGLSGQVNGVLVGHLSVAGVLYCGLLLPLQTVAYHHRHWPLHPALCPAAAAARVWLIGVTMCLLSAIAVYRFIHVVYPQSYRQWCERRVFYPIITFCWTFGLLFSLGPAWGWGAYGFESRILQCTFSSVYGGSSHKITVITLGYVFPCVFICGCYARIGCVVFRSRRRAMRGSLHGRRRRRRGSVRLAAMMAVIFLAFFLGTTPYFLINVLDPRQRIPLAHVWGPTAAWLLYCLHPLVYTLMDAHFHTAFRQLLACRVCWQGDALRHLNSLRSQQSSI